MTIDVDWSKLWMPLISPFFLIFSGSSELTVITKMPYLHSAMLVVVMLMSIHTHCLELGWYTISFSTCQLHPKGFGLGELHIYMHMCMYFAPWLFIWCIWLLHIGSISLRFRLGLLQRTITCRWIQEVTFYGWIVLDVTIVPRKATLEYVHFLTSHNDNFSIQDHRKNILLFYWFMLL